MNILVVDDEKEIADLIEIYLKNENYKVYKYYSSKNVLENLKEMHIDLAILDIMMPDIDGFSLCKNIRKTYNFPIIFVTAKVEDIDKISGLTIGADDYITKPFEPLELLARVKAQLRRYKKYNQNISDENVIDFRNILINQNTHEFYLNNEKIPTKLSTGVAKKGSTDIAENCNHNINKRKNNKDNINYTNYYNNYKENVPNWIKNEELCNIVESNDKEKKEMEVILNEMY